VRIHSLGHSLSQSVLPSLSRRLWFVFPLTNAQLDLTKRKMFSNGSVNVKHSEINYNEIDFSYVKGVGCASIFLFFEFSKMTYNAFVVIV